MKRCPFCAEEIQDAAIKCRHCGSMLNEPVPVADKPAELARVIYGGTPSWKAWYGRYMLAGLLAVVGVAGGAALYVKLEQHKPVGLIAGAALVVASLVLFVAVELKRRATKYRLTSRTIDVEEGVLSRRIETLQLWRVRDVTFEQSLTQRMLGVATVRVVAHDDTSPQLLLSGLQDGRRVFEELKVAVDQARQTRNVVGLVE